MVIATNQLPGRQTADVEGARKLIRQHRVQCLTFDRPDVEEHVTKEQSPSR